MRISDWSSDVCSSDLNVIEKNPSPPDSRRRPFFLSMDDGVPPLLGVNNFSPAHDLAALLEYLIGASGRHIIPAPATAPDHPSITDAFDALRVTAQDFEVVPGMSTANHRWTESEEHTDDLQALI